MTKIEPMLEEALGEGAVEEELLQHGY